MTSTNEKPPSPTCSEQSFVDSYDLTKDERAIYHIQQKILALGDGFYFPVIAHFKSLVESTKTKDFGGPQATALRAFFHTAVMNEQRRWEEFVALLEDYEECDLLEARALIKQLHVESKRVATIHDELVVMLKFCKKSHRTGKLVPKLEVASRVLNRWWQTRSVGDMVPLAVIAEQVIKEAARRRAIDSQGREW